ncbi:MAG: hypothetical protein R3338_05120 [Thermoanaerobaculia bacterium]|nr:hypothetical protein [Thermoanaerobaculia bacterium]
MPRILFYVGIVFSIVIALMLVVTVAEQVVGGELLRYDQTVVQGLASHGSSEVVLVVLMAIPVCALYLRIASLIAIRNLFAAVLSVSAISCALLSGLFLFSLKLEREVLAGIDTNLIGVNLSVVAGHLVAIFVSLTFVTLLPYFALHNRAVAALTSAPAASYLLVLALRFLDRWALGEALSSAVFLISLAATSAAIAIHSFRHRHPFLEITSLRDLLSGPVVQRLGVSGVRS